MSICRLVRKFVYVCKRPQALKMCSNSSPALSVLGLFQSLFFTFTSQPIIETRLRLAGISFRHVERKTGTEARDGQPYTEKNKRLGEINTP